MVRDKMKDSFLRLLVILNTGKVNFGLWFYGI